MKDFVGQIKIENTETISHQSYKSNMFRVGPPETDKVNFFDQNNMIKLFSPTQTYTQSQFDQDTKTQTPVRSLNHEIKKRIDNQRLRTSQSQRTQVFGQQRKKNEFFLTQDAPLESQFQFLDIKSSLESAGKKMKYFTNLQQEFEILNFQMFFGVSNDEIKSSKGMQILSEQPISATIQDQGDQFSTKSMSNSIKFDKTGQKVIGPSGIRSLFQDTNDLFQQLQKAQDLDFSKSELDFHFQKQIEGDILQIQRKYRRYMQYIIRESGFMSGVVIDMLWKSLLLKIDQCLLLMNSQISREKDKQSKDFLRNLEEQQLKEKSFEQEKSELNRKYDAQLKHLNSLIKELTHEKMASQKQLDDFKADLESMELGENKRKSMSQFSETYTNLNYFLDKVKSEQKNRIQTLVRLEALMGAERGYNSLGVREDELLFTLEQTQEHCENFFNLYKQLASESNTHITFEDLILKESLKINNSINKTATFLFKYFHSSSFIKSLFHAFVAQDKYFNKFLGKELIQGFDQVLTSQTLQANLLKQSASGYRIKEILDSFDSKTFLKLNLTIFLLIADLESKNLNLRSRFREYDRQSKFKEYNEFLSQTINSQPFNSVLQSIKIDSRIVPIYISFALEHIEQRRIQNLREKFNQELFKQQTHFGDQTQNIQDKQVGTPEFHFDFDGFGKFTDDFLFNSQAFSNKDLVPDLVNNLDMKYQLFLPICTGGGIINPNNYTGFNQMIDKAFDIFSVKQYNESITFNKLLYEPQEKLEKFDKPEQDLIDTEHKIQQELKDQEQFKIEDDATNLIKRTGKKKKVKG
eukprot:403341822